MVMMLSLSRAVASCDGVTVSEHIHGGPLCVPSDAERIVTLEPWLTLGTLFELDVPVIGAPMMGVQEEALKAEAARLGVADIGHPMQPSLERIAALRPDLIIGSAYMHAQAYEKLSAIAPTLLVDAIGWKDHYRLLAGITGKAEDAESAIGAYEDRAEEIRSHVPDGLEVSVVRVAPTGFQVYLDGPAAYAPYAVLGEAGVSRTPYEMTGDDTAVKRPDWEELAALDGDVLLYVVVSGYDTGPDEQLAADTVGNPLWQMLPAVAAGRAHRVDRLTWMAFHGIASAHRVLDDVERYVLTAP